MASFSGIKNTLLASRRTKKLPPPMTQTQKTARPRSDMLRGLLSFFMEKNHAFPGRCGTYFLSTGSAVITMTRTVTSLPLSLSSILQSAVPM